MHNLWIYQPTKYNYRIFQKLQKIAFLCPTATEITTILTHFGHLDILFSWNSYASLLLLLTVLLLFSLLLCRSCLYILKNIFFRYIYYKYPLSTFFCFPINSFNRIFWWTEISNLINLWVCLLAIFVDLLEALDL